MRRFATFIGLASVFVAGSATADYTAVILNPSGFSQSVALGAGDGQQVGYGYPSQSSETHALLWSGTAESCIDLNPAGFSRSKAYGVSGGQQVGYGVDQQGSAHALLWSGTPQSYVDLCPPGWSAYASGISGGQQVGEGFSALLWSGSAGSLVILYYAGQFGNPSGALDISGGQQVGFIGTGGYVNPSEHAALWTGTPESLVDLNPAGFYYSGASGVSGGQQAGYGAGDPTGGFTHALLWSGTAESVIDLNPAGCTFSRAFDIAGGLEVGEGDGHALLWSGTPESCIDLQAFLPAGYDGGSIAYGIDSSGNIVGFAENGIGPQAVLWEYQQPTTIPAPAALVLASVGLGVVDWLRRRKTL